MERDELEASMEAAWRHTDTLIFQSRYQEILQLVQDDPLEDLMKVGVPGHATEIRDACLARGRGLCPHENPGVAGTSNRMR